MAGNGAFVYKGARRNEVRFPLGGIGAGNICIDGGARFVDWEIMNRPNKDSYNGYSHIAIKAERAGKTLDARALHGPLPPPYMGRGLHSFGGYTYGPARETLAGVPHFEDVAMTGRFPEAVYNFSGEFPGTVALRAFSPFEPGNDFDSSLPVACFEITVENAQSQPVDYSVAFTCANPNRQKPVNSVHKSEDGESVALLLGTGGDDPYAPSYGELCLVAQTAGALKGADASWQQNWYRGSWFDGLNVFWQDFAKPGKLKDRQLPPMERVGGGDLDMLDHGTLCVRTRLAAKAKATFRFALAWYYPNYEKYWNAPPPVSSMVNAPGAASWVAPPQNPVWRNWYATVFTGARDAAYYAFSNWDRLDAAVRRFVDALYGATLPPEVIDAAGSTLAVLKSPTCLRLTDGSFYGWEGSHARHGSCEGSCQHVWNYQYALPMLFPALERSMRELDYCYNLQADGSMPFRLQLPPGSPPSKFRACADGQMGGVIKTYREWKLSGDGAWLAKIWPRVRRSLEFAWSPRNPDLWDPQMTGVLTGRQHHTLDMELFGPNAWLTGMYLCALEAAARMAEAVGEADFAQKCRKLREQGARRAEETLFNGEYYIQSVQLEDRKALDPYAAHDPNVYKSYWNDEAGELKYQIGEGCSIDQLLGQWHADLCGLGDVFSRRRVHSALAAIYKHNFVPRMGDRFNPCRLYCLQDEAGLVICAYPEGARRPVISAPYAEETMHGFEYAAACHMIMNGMEEEGLRCVRAVRDRYDGERRNPWNEIECGGNYARSMAAWALVNAYEGLQVDMTQGSVAFGRLRPDKAFSCVWAFAGAWGKVTAGDGAVTLECYGGELALRSLALADVESVAGVSGVTLGGQPVSFKKDGAALRFVDAKNSSEHGGVRIGAGAALVVRAKTAE